MIRLDGAGFTVSVPRAGAAPVLKTVLHPVTLTLSQRRIAVVGPNGSGKSTLLRLLNGLLSPSCGSVSVEGHDTRTAAAAVRGRVGFIFTDPLSQLVLATPADDVELSLRRRVKDRKLRAVQARELLADRGLGHLADQSVYDLSGGERQLVALTSVLACEPGIVVADEPTTLLDLRNRELVATALWGLDQQVIIATHDLDLAVRAERVLVIEDGRVVGDGDPQTQVDSYRNRMTT